MKTTHTTTVHATCPHGCWDYYRVEFEPAEFMRTESFEGACSLIRGAKLYQELLTQKLAEVLPPGLLRVTGMHGANVTTTCEVQA